MINEEFEDTKAVVKIWKSKKVQQHNGQQKKDKRTNNDLQSINTDIYDGATRTPRKIGVNS